MTAEIPTPQIPEQLRELIDAWGRKHSHITEIDRQVAEIEPAMAELQRQIADLNRRHTDLGRERYDAVEAAKFAHSVASHGCQLAGVEMPAAPAAQQPPPAPLPSGVEPVSGQQAVQALTDLSPSGPLETVSDPGPVEVVPQNPAGGDQSGSPDFQPEPAEADSRRRRGARRG